MTCDGYGVGDSMLECVCLFRVEKIGKEIRRED